MSTKSIIKRLNKSINEKKSSDSIKGYTDILIETITDAAKEPLFYSLPFEHISNIIKRIEFNNENQISEPLLLLQTLIEKTSEFHEKESVLLLNDIKIDQLPKLTIDDIIIILTIFHNFKNVNF